MYELFQTLMGWDDAPADDDANALDATETANEAPAPDLDRCFEAVEQQLFDPS